MDQIYEKLTNSIFNGASISTAISQILNEFILPDLSNLILYYHSFVDYIWELQSIDKNTKFLAEFHLARLQGGSKFLLNHNTQQMLDFILKVKNKYDNFYVPYIQPWFIGKGSQIIKWILYNQFINFGKKIVVNSNPYFNVEILLYLSLDDIYIVKSSVDTTTLLSMIMRESIIIDRKWRPSYIISHFPLGVGLFKSIENVPIPSIDDIDKSSFYKSLLRQLTIIKMPNKVKFGKDDLKFLELELHFYWQKLAKIYGN